MACTYDPSNVKGPIGMFHCPECGEMVVAGIPHPTPLDELDIPCCSACGAGPLSLEDQKTGLCQPCLDKKKG